jgi:hypothetical protein
MDQVLFDARMNSLDKDLAGRGRNITIRFLDTFHAVTGASRVDFLPRDPSLGPYEGPNLLWAMIDWYAERYPKQMLIGADWGPRPIVIRGVVYHAEIPVHFNPSSPLDAFGFLHDVPPALRRALDSTEEEGVQRRYNQLFVQASDMTLLETKWQVHSGGGLVGQLLRTGRADLRMICDYILSREPGAVLFAAQQGPEKFLKALLSFADPTLTEGQLKAKYGHKVPQLLEAGAKVAPGLAHLRSRVGLLDFGPDVRYRCQAITPVEAVEVIDFSHDICHKIALHLLGELGRKKGSSGESAPSPRRR